MTGDPTFVDTNVLVYAYDADAGAKHEIARSRLRVLWEDESGLLSTQVLQEFYVTVTRKLSQPMRRRKAREDALIIVSARRSGARLLLTENLQDGQRFGGMVVVSPFRQASAGEPPTTE